MQHDRNYVRWMVLYIYICAHHLHMGNSHMYICTCNCTHEIRLHHHACTCRHAQNKTVYHVCVLYNKISYANTTSNFCWILGRKGAKRGNDAKQKMVKPKSSSRIGFTNYSCSQCSPGIYLSIYRSIDRSVSLSLSSTYLSIYLSACLSIHLSISLFLFHLSICLAVYLSIYLSVCLSTCLSVVQCHSV